MTMRRHHVRRKRRRARAKLRKHKRVGGRTGWGPQQAAWRRERG